MPPSPSPSLPLPRDARLGRVFLRVRDLEAEVGFYQDVLGLQLLERHPGGAVLGAGERGLLGLISAPESIPAPRGPGLYHLALLLPDRPSLGRFLEHAVRRRARLQGASDHGVSEAVYLADPEGNGLEVYRDYPREEWPMNGEQVAMLTAPLDARSLLEGARGAPSAFTAPAGTVLGHVHLQVSDVERAQRRFGEVIGLDVTQSDYPGARFFSAGGYHHHVGVNSWASAGRPAAPPDSLGLAWFEIEIPDPDARAALEARLEGAGGSRPSVVDDFPATLHFDDDGLAVAVTGG